MRAIIAKMFTSKYVPNLESNFTIVFITKIWVMWTFESLKSDKKMLLKLPCKAAKIYVHVCPFTTWIQHLYTCWNALTPCCHVVALDHAIWKQQRLPCHLVLFNLLISFSSFRARLNFDFCKQTMKSYIFQHFESNGTVGIPNGAFHNNMMVSLLYVQLLIKSHRGFKSHLDIPSIKQRDVLDQNWHFKANHAIKILI